MAASHADVVQQRGHGDLRLVADRRGGTAPQDVERLVADLRAVLQQQRPQGRLLRIEVAQDLQRVAGGVFIGHGAPPPAA